MLITLGKLKQIGVVQYFKRLNIGTTNTDIRNKNKKKYLKILTDFPQVISFFIIFLSFFFYIYWLRERERENVSWHEAVVKG